MAVSWDGIHPGNMRGPIYSYFAQPFPADGVVWPQNGPRMAQTGPDGPGTSTPGGLVAVSWDGIHLGNVRAAFWSCFACLSPVNGVCGLPPPKTAPNGPEIGPKMAETARRKALDPLGCSKTRFRGRF